MAFTGKVIIKIVLMISEDSSSNPATLMQDVVKVGAQVTTFETVTINISKEILSFVVWPFTLPTFWTFCFESFIVICIAQ